ncbi:hypothetical protein TrispH2_001838 [Trichoplax sp. H2]|nr:hypothetical protein TrispH2_001838 [Trichoplax sp. H2]|eukprot:RDD45947.1 hypothetical protein TrispH2_001838 [Trichoplax sp. H2]
MANNGMFKIDRTHLPSSSGVEFCKNTNSGQCTKAEDAATKSSHTIYPGRLCAKKEYSNLAERMDSDHNNDTDVQKCSNFNSASLLVYPHILSRQHLLTIFDQREISVDRSLDKIALLKLYQQYIMPRAKRSERPLSMQLQARNQSDHSLTTPSANQADDLCNSQLFTTGEATANWINDEDSTLGRTSNRHDVHNGDLTSDFIDNTSKPNHQINSQRKRALKIVQQGTMAPDDNPKEAKIVRMADNTNITINRTSTSQQFPSTSSPNNNMNLDGPSSVHAKRKALTPKRMRHRRKNYPKLKSLPGLSVRFEISC